MNESTDLFGFLSNHDDILTDAAYVVALGMAGVYLLHRLVKRFFTLTCAVPGGSQQYLVPRMW